LQMRSNGPTEGMHGRPGFRRHTALGNGRPQFGPWVIDSKVFEGLRGFRLDNGVFMRIEPQVTDMSAKSQQPGLGRGADPIWP